MNSPESVDYKGKQTSSSENEDKVKDYRIAVLDFGKTNKKIAVFTPELDLEYKESIQIGETNKDGFLSDDMPEAMSWVLKTMKKIAEQFNIRAISVTTFGATVALLDEKGETVFPVISYNQEPDDDIKRRFFDTFGSPEDLYKNTGTPQYGQLLNVGIQLFWLKERYRERFSLVKNILFLPQYIGYMLTGERAVDLTTAGAHTYLYDFNKKGWSSVAEGMQMKDRFPSAFSHPWDILGDIKKEIQKATGLRDDCKVVVGIHDSNASLLPYMLTEDDFVLASTGTWCVFMRPNAGFSVSEADLCRDVLYYLDPFGQPVKAARFKGGEEHDHYAFLIRKRFGENPFDMKADPDILEEILRSADSFVVPALTQGSGPFPNSKPGIIGEEKFYGSIERAYHTLCLSLAIQSSICIKEISMKKTDVFVDGGFSNNRVYLSILSTILQDNRLFASRLKEGTSLGAAICAKCGLEHTDPTRIEKSIIRMDKEEIKKLAVDEAQMKRYVDKFIAICDSGGKQG